MKVVHSTYGEQDGLKRFRATITGDNGTQIQLDVVGQMAFLFKRVMQGDHTLEVDATDNTLQFRQRPKPQPKAKAKKTADEPTNFKRSLKKEV